MTGEKKKKMRDTLDRYFAGIPGADTGTKTSELVVGDTTALGPSATDFNHCWFDVGRLPVAAGRFRGFLAVCVDCLAFMGLFPHVLWCTVRGLLSLWCQGTYRDES